MKILALQLKRIGDLVLTTPALRAIRAAWPEAHVALGVMDGTASLLPAIPNVDGGIVFGRGPALTPWQQTFTGGWDLCFDFTGNDRSALASALSRAKTRVTFEAAKRTKLRSRAYNTWCPSKVRELHTTRHYLDLVTQVAPADAAASEDLLPELSLPLAERDEAAAHLRHNGDCGAYALLHPGTARPEKCWLPERWGEIARHLQKTHGLRTVFTCGPADWERAHVQAIPSVDRSDGKSTVMYPDRLLQLAALVAQARIVISCDTGVVHLASAFRVPQISLFGPTNPFHWRPMHDRALVLSAAQPEAPLTEFTPRLKGAPMDRISTGAVIHAIDSLLAPPREAP